MLRSDFTLFIGTLQSFIHFCQTRKADGTQRSTTPTTSPTPTTNPNLPPLGNALDILMPTQLAPLKSVRDALLEASFDFEVAEKQFETNWRAQGGPLFVEIEKLLTGDPVSTKHFGKLLMLKAHFNKAAIKGCDGSTARHFINNLRADLHTLETTSGGLHQAQIAGIRTMVDQLDVIRLALNDTSNPATPWQMFETDLETQSKPFTDAFESLVGTIQNDQVRAVNPQVAPWSAMDEKLQELMKHFYKVSKETVGGGGGGYGVSSWGGVAGGSSSSSSSSSSSGS